MSDYSLLYNPIESEFEKLKIGTEPKTMEFLDLPTDLHNVIIEHLGLKERLLLRKVSRELRALVDQKKSILKSAQIKSNPDYICVRYRDEEVVAKNYPNLFYDKDNDDEVVYANPEDSNFFLIQFGDQKPKLIRTKNFVETALADAQFLFKDPTLQLEKLCVAYYPGDTPDGHPDNFFPKEFENLLKSLDHKVSTRHFTTNTDLRYIISGVLPNLKPGTLETIEFGGAIWSDRYHGLNEIVELDQWKQAKGIIFEHAKNIWAEEHLMHFERFLVVSMVMDLAEFSNWRDLFSKSSNFKFGQISGAHFIFDIGNHFGDFISSNIKDGWYQTFTFHHPSISDANQVLEIELAPNANLFFTKIPRPSV